MGAERRAGTESKWMWLTRRNSMIIRVLYRSLRLCHVDKEMAGKEIV